MLENKHALQEAANIGQVRRENKDVAIQAAMFIGSLVQQLAGGPMIRAGTAPALEVLRMLDDTWLFEIRELEPVRQAVNVLERAQGVHGANVPTVDTVRMVVEEFV